MLPQVNTPNELLSYSYLSNEEFASMYGQFDGKAEARELYLLLLTELKNAIVNDYVDSLEKITNLIECMCCVENEETLKDYYNDTSNPIKNTNVIILACQHNNVKILNHMLCNFEVLNKFFINIVGEDYIAPDNRDEMCHNSFYYAIRSGNVELIKVLLNKWPGDYFNAHLDELDEILATAYEELKLKNVQLSDEVETFVEDKLIQLRFFNTGQVNVEYNPKERIELVLDSIRLLRTEYLNIKTVDERFLFIAKFVAQNIHILKRQLKLTYDKIPWEEMEFCLLAFVFSHVKQQEINLFNLATLNKEKILHHLKNFANKIEGYVLENKYVKSTTLPNLRREKVIEQIIKNDPQFEDLYHDHQQVRDIHSLEKIDSYINLASSADPNKREGQIIITRVLQVIGEYVKNTLESPNLSSTTSELLLLSLPKNLRKIVTDLRNSLSHAYSFSKRTEIEDNKDVDFFIGVQNDIKKIGNVVADIFSNNKIKTFRILLERIIHSKNFDEIKEVAKVLGNVKLDKKASASFKIIEQEKLQKLVIELSNNITEKTDQEQKLFSEINDIISSQKSKSEHFEENYYLGLATLKSVSYVLEDCKIDENVIRLLKFQSNVALENITSKIAPQSLKEIAGLSTKIFESVKSRVDHSLDEVNRLVLEIFYVAQFGINNIKWIEELKEKLIEKKRFIPACNQKNIPTTKEKYNKQLKDKLSELEKILNKHTSSTLFIENFSVYKSNKNMQAVVEMLVLDIMSILDSSNKCLENNLLFVDDNAPILIGKCLRNHLAHDNALVNMALLCDYSKAVFFNAKKLIAENVIKSKKKIGKLVKEDTSNLNVKYNQSLCALSNQEKMFLSLEEGNFESLKSCLGKGADINARNFKLWTALHFACKGPNLDIVKFIIDKNPNFNKKNANGQNPLHIAAVYGRKNIVEYLIKEKGMLVDDIDSMGKTPLHIAAVNGHKDTVVVLIQNRANTIKQDFGGLSPLHQAIKNGHLDVSKVLMGKKTNADINETMGGFTALHAAAERGYLELVAFLVKNGANVNKKNDRDWNPLHGAALNGHLDVVNFLISKGANVNSKVLDGCTPLHYAVETGREHIVSILLKHGAEVNAYDKTYHNMPLHYAAKDGYEGIVKILLQNKAKPNTVTVDGFAPLHLAAMSGHLGIVEALLKYDIDINARNINNSTPLHYAAENGHEAIVDLLLRNGASIAVMNCEGLTPLHAAVSKNHLDVTKLLLKNVKINIKARNGLTPLHVAAINESVNVIEFLIKNEAEIDVRDDTDLTPLHAASANGCKDAAELLIKYNADVNSRNIVKVTPLHLAALGNHVDVMDILIKNGADVNAKEFTDTIPLHAAVEAGHKEAIEILIANGSDVNVKNTYNMTPLLSAVKHNYKEILEFLISNEADIGVESNKPLQVAVFSGYRDIVKILLNNGACVNTKYVENATLLHLAAKRGQKEIVKALIMKGAIVNAKTIHDATPLLFATQEGYQDVVEILIANQANVNMKNNEGSTPLHVVAVRGHIDVLKVLLKNKSNIETKDYKNRTPVELAVAHGHLQIVKILLSYKVDIHMKCNGGWTLLHIAAQESNVDMIKYLISIGCDINAKNDSGSKPIHIAAREGFKESVNIFLNKGSSINELGCASQTLLHYATINGAVEIIKYLLAQGADVNVKDANAVTPLHIAASSDNTHVIELLLKNGAAYNVFDKFGRKPLEMTRNKGVFTLLMSTGQLFETVKHNNTLEVEKCIRNGAVVNAKNSKNETPLHYAVWKDHFEVVNILLQNKANPNAISSKGTPLHYAAKFSTLKVVKALLYNGAIYNAVSDTGKTPLGLAVDENIKALLKLVEKSFISVKRNSIDVISSLKKIKEVDTVKAIMNACNKENRTLIVAALHCNFSKAEQLKDILQNDVSSRITTATMFIHQNNFQEALTLFRSVFEKRKEIFGPDNPATLDIQIWIAKVLYKQGSYQEALNMLEGIFLKQKESLGINFEDTLSTRSFIGLILHRQGKDEEALNIYQEICARQKEILGPDHPDTLESLLNMALVLDRLKQYDKAVNINKEVYKKRKQADHPAALNAQNNIAMVLANQSKYEEALKVYKEVLEKKKVHFGIYHADTLRTSHNIAGVLLAQNKHREGLEAFKEIVNIQKNALGPNHPDTLNSQYNIANALFGHGMHANALKAYKECLNQRKIVFGPNHPSVLDILQKIELINLRFKMEGTKESDILQYFEKDIFVAADNGDLKTIQYLLENGTDVNDKDIDGRTPLHFAVNNGHLDIVNVLLQYKGDATMITNKGNTPLHTAASKGYQEIAKILLQHVGHDKLIEFINVQTLVGGNTTLHVAAKKGSLDLVTSLLEHGATYDVRNKEDETPLRLSTDKGVIAILKLIEELFDDAKLGNNQIINKLKILKPNEFSAMINARNKQGNTLLQVAISNKHKQIAALLLKMLQTPGQTVSSINKN